MKLLMAYVGKVLKVAELHKYVMIFQNTKKKKTNTTYRYNLGFVSILKILCGGNCDANFVNYFEITVN